MKLFRNKRGDDKTYFMFFETILVILVFTILLLFVKNSIDSTYFERIYNSRNIALVLDSTYGVPGNLYFEYRLLKEKGLRVNFLEGFVAVDKDENPSKYRYYSNPYTFWIYESNKSMNINFLKIPITYIFPPSPQLSKSGDKLTIEKDTFSTLNHLRCPRVDTAKDLKDVKLIIDSGPKDTEEWHFFVFLHEKDIVSSITDELDSNYGSSFDNNIQLTRDENNEKTEEERKEFIKTNSEDTDVIISLHVMETPSDLNFIRAYIPSDNIKSRKLSCLIINNILDKFDSYTTKDLQGKKVLEKYYDSASIAITDDISLFEGITEKSIVYLEIANINNEKGRDILKSENYEKLSEAIFDGTTKYFTSSCLEDDGCNDDCENGDPDCECNAQFKDGFNHLCEGSGKRCFKSEVVYSSDTNKNIVNTFNEQNILFEFYKPQRKGIYYLNNDNPLNSDEIELQHLDDGSITLKSELGEGIIEKPEYPKVYTFDFGEDYTIDVKITSTSVYGISLTVTQTSNLCCELSCCGDGFKQGSEECEVDQEMLCSDMPGYKGSGKITCDNFCYFDKTECKRCATKDVPCSVNENCCDDLICSDTKVCA